MRPWAPGAFSPASTSGRVSQSASVSARTRWRIPVSSCPPGAGAQGPYVLRDPGGGQDGPAHDGGDERAPVGFREELFRLLDVGEDLDEDGPVDAGADGDGCQVGDAEVAADGAHAGWLQPAVGAP